LFRAERGGIIVRRENPLGLLFFAFPFPFPIAHTESILLGCIFCEAEKKILFIQRSRKAKELEREAIAKFILYVELMIDAVAVCH
jgi:hypothetical protein